METVKKNNGASVALYLIAGLILFLVVAVLMIKDHERRIFKRVVGHQVEQVFQEIYGPKPDAGMFKDASPAELKEVVKIWEMLRGAFITGTENFRMTNDSNLHKALATAAAKGRYQRFLIWCKLKPKEKGCQEY